MRRAPESDYRYVTLEGARIAYQVSGTGPDIVMIKNNRRPLNLPAARLASDRFRVFEIHPVGFGASDRPESYAFGSIAAQVLAVMDQEGVDRFTVWGFSQTACMAAMVARSTERANALIAGGVELIGNPTDATFRRMERKPGFPRPPLEFWRAYRSFDWHHELRTMTQPKLIYIGTDDPRWKRLRKLEPVLRGCGCEYLQFEGLNHQTAGLGDDSEGSRTTVGTIITWIRRSVSD